MQMLTVAQFSGRARDPRHNHYHLYSHSHRHHESISAQCSVLSDMIMINSIWLDERYVYLGNSCGNHYSKHKRCCCLPSFTLQTPKRNLVHKIYISNDFCLVFLQGYFDFNIFREVVAPNQVISFSSIVNFLIFFFPIFFFFLSKIRIDKLETYSQKQTKTMPAA